MKELLRVSNLSAQADDKQILKNLNLVVNAGEAHVIMGPNGAGKSTFSNVIFNNEHYEKTNGTVIFDGVDITDEDTHKIAQMGMFMSFQMPVEIPGISTLNFLKYSKGKKDNKVIKTPELRKIVQEYADTLQIDKKLISRYLNVGFSGGERKKNEILQMLTLQPKLSILDETDSGLDFDAIKTVSQGIKLFQSNPENSLIIITHNLKILENIKVDYVHILVDGTIVETGDRSLCAKVAANGFEHYKH